MINKDKLSKWLLDNMENDIALAVNVIIFTILWIVSVVSALVILMGLSILTSLPLFFLFPESFIRFGLSHYDNPSIDALYLMFMGSGIAIWVVLFLLLLLVVSQKRSIQETYPKRKPK